MMMPLVCDEEIMDADWLPPKEFLGSTFPASPWEEHAIVIIWSILLFGYLLVMSPLLFLSAFFWLAAVEWSMESMLWFSSDNLDADDDDQHAVTETESNEKANTNGKEHRTAVTKSDHNAPPLVNADLHEWN